MLCKKMISFVDSPLLSPPIERGEILGVIGDSEAAMGGDAVKMQCTFEAYCKAVLRNEVRNIQRNRKRQEGREALMSELSDRQIARLAHEDSYQALLKVCVIQGIAVEVEMGDEALVSALSQLRPAQRDIILLSYFADMSDGEIARVLTLTQGTVQYRRTSSLTRLRTILEEIEHER